MVSGTGVKNQFLAKSQLTGTEISAFNLGSLGDVLMTPLHTAHHHEVRHLRDERTFHLFENIVLEIGTQFNQSYHEFFKNIIYQIIWVSGTYLSGTIGLVVFLNPKF